MDENDFIPILLGKGIKCLEHLRRDVYCRLSGLLV